MQFFVSVLRPHEEQSDARDLIVVAEPESTIGDLVTVLDRAMPGTDRAMPDPTAGQPLRLVVGASGGAQNPAGPAAPASSLWHGATRLDPTMPLAGGPVRDGMLLSLGAPILDDVEPVGVVELRVVSGEGAGAVHRLTLGNYTMGGAGCDIVLEGFEDGVVADVVVKVGAQVVLRPAEGVAERKAPTVMPRRRPLPGPLVLASDKDEDDEDKGKKKRKRRKNKKKKRRQRRKEGEEAVLQGRETLDPEAPRHLVELDRRPLDKENVWDEGVMLSVGGIMLTVGPVPAADAVTTPTPGGTTVDFNRPPRLARPERKTEFVLPRKPERPRKQAFPFAMMLSPLVMGLGMYLMTHRIYSLMFMIFSPIMMIANRVQGRSNNKKTYRENIERYEKEREATEEAAFKALTEERGLRRLDSPDPAEALLRATGPRAELWERRPSDRDWLELRVGTADLPSGVVVAEPMRARHEEPMRWTAPDVPVTVPLAELGAIGVSGEKRHRVVGWLAAQCAVLHSPAELEMVLITDPDQGAQAQDRWTWARWLPHLRNAEGMGARSKVGVDEESVNRRINELLEIIEVRSQDNNGGRGLPESTTQVLVVLDGAYALRLRPGMVRVLREGPRVGIRFICVDADRTALPEECRAVVATGPGLPSVSQTDVDEIEHVLLDLVPDGWCERVARGLAPVHDISTEDADSTIPTASRLLDVLRMPEPDASIVLQAWERISRTTSAVIGEDAEGVFGLDVRADGPHALVAGTTGSGKSELLQTLIASLCVGNTPEAMTFVLVDYKGGAAFKDCARLPHTVGMVTDLDGHLTSRALESLGAELRRREHQLKDADAKDIEDYVAAMKPGDEPMPRLMIIIDEFAALVSELPDFVTGLVDIARRGRSLGVHLVLATQRPAGVITAEIRSNTNLRIALRVTDEADSQDVIEASASAHIPASIPGRAFARLGHASLRQFQASRVGGRPTGSGPRAELRTSTLTLSELSRPELAPPVREEDATIPTDLANLVGAIGEAFSSLGRPMPHSPWLPPLPEIITLDEVDRRVSEELQRPGGRDDAAGSGPGGRDAAADAGHEGDGPTVGSAGGSAGADSRAEGFLPPLPLGIEDLPALQAQRPMTWDYTRAGHLGIAGAARSGRSSVLRGIAVAVAQSASAAEVHMYGIDAGNGALLPCVSLPHMGAVVTRDQLDRVRRLLALLGREVARRQQFLAVHGFASLSEQRAATAPDERLPYLLLLIDRWDSFVASFESVDGGALLENVETLLREGAAVGLRVVVAGDRTVFRGRFGMMLEDRLLLRMPSPDDFDLVGMRARDVPLSMPVGRAFRSGVTPREVQLALLTANTAGTAQVAAIHEAGRVSTERWGEPSRSRRPGRVDDLPVTITAAEALALGPEVKPGSIALAIGGDDLGLIPVAMDEVGNGVLVTGPRRSGRSTALAFGASTALAGGARLVLMLPRRSALAALADREGVAAVLGPDTKPDELRKVLKEQTTETLLVVDDFDVLGNDHPLGPVFEEHLKACRDAAGGVLIACGIDEVGGMYRGIVAQVRKNRTGLILAPRGADDGSHLSVRLPRSIGGPVPKGRGVFVTTGGWSWVQVPRPGDEG